MIDTWIESVAHNRTNVAPANLPWDMICYLVRETYGGKIDSEGDFQILDKLVRQTLTPDAYEIGHKLVDSPSSGDSLEVPQGTNYNEFMAWITRLPEREPPTYLGLPANAEKLLLVGQGNGMIGDVRKVTELLDEGEALMTES